MGPTDNPERRHAHKDGGGRVANGPAPAAARCPQRSMDSNKHERGGKPEAKADGELRAEKDRGADRQAARCTEKMRQRDQTRNRARRSEGPKRREGYADGEGERMPAPSECAGDDAAGDEQGRVQETTA